MKKLVSILTLLCFLLMTAAGCAKNDAAVADAGISGARGGLSNADKNVDIDLTMLSSTIVYAEVNSIMTTPDDYIGKTIKMKGPYNASFYDATNLYYHYVIVEDAAACCVQGLEFKWKGEHLYPEDYPQEDSKIEVTGVFSSYEELGKTYYYLAVDDILIME